MIADASGEDLIAIAREVILATIDREWIWVGIKCGRSTMRHREGIMFEVIFPIILEFIHREVCHPAECKVFTLHEAESITTCESYSPEYLTSSLIFSSPEKNHISHLWCEFLRECLEFIPGEELEYRRFRAISLIDDVGKTSCSE